VVGGAVDQTRTEVFFELAQCTGEGGLAGVEAGGGPGDVPFLGNGEEGPQVPQLHGHICEAERLMD
jgi:hypothetical protein